jgi:hypothetical protein
MVSAIAHANEMTMNYGVKILSINIIQAQPNDDALMMQLAQVCLKIAIMYPKAVKTKTNQEPTV